MQRSFLVPQLLFVLCTSSVIGAQQLAQTQQLELARDRAQGALICAALGSALGRLTMQLNYAHTPRQQAMLEKFGAMKDAYDMESLLQESLYTSLTVDGYQRCATPVLDNHAPVSLGMLLAKMGVEAEIRTPRQPAAQLLTAINNTQFNFIKAELEKHQRNVLDYPLRGSIIYELSTGGKPSFEHMVLEQCALLGLVRRGTSLEEFIETAVNLPQQLAHAVGAGVGRAYSGDSVEQVVHTMKGVARSHAAVIAQAYELAQNNLNFEKSFTGKTAQEVVAAAVYVFAKYAESGDVRKAIMEAVTMPGNSDTIALLVGSLMGARCGVSKLAIRQDALQLLEHFTDLKNLAHKVAQQTQGVVRPLQPAVPVLIHPEQQVATQNNAFDFESKYQDHQLQEQDEQALEHSILAGLNDDIPLVVPESALSSEDQDALSLLASAQSVVSPFAVQAMPDTSGTLTPVSPPLVQLPVSVPPAPAPAIATTTTPSFIAMAKSYQTHMIFGVVSAALLTLGWRIAKGRGKQQYAPLAAS